MARWSRNQRPDRVARPRAVLAAMLLVGTAAACSGGDSGPPTLTSYTNPDNGGQQDPAAKCTEAAEGRYRIDVAVLPTDANGQRERLVRRLAANDSSIDLMSLDPVFVPSSPRPASCGRSATTRAPS